MRINQHDTGFQAVIIKPTPQLWSQKVLNSVLESKHIRKIIKNNEKQGKDTFLKYNENLNFSSFTLESETDNIRLYAGDSIKRLDHENMLIKKIKEMDNPHHKTELEINLENLKKIASNIIYN